MKKMSLLSLRFILFTFLVFSFSSCAKDDDDNNNNNNQTAKSRLTIEFRTEAAAKPFKQYDTLTNENGQQYSVSLLRFYAGNIRLIKQDGSELNLKDIALVDFYMKEADANAGVNSRFSFEVPAEDYKGIRFGVGVPESLNGLKTNSHDPSQYSAEHPLSPTYSTSWSMAGGGYRFVMMDGRVFKTGSDSSKKYTYHTGFDELYREVEIKKDFSTKSAPENTFTITLDVNKIFYSAAGQIDMWNEPFTHSVGDAQLELAKRFTENFYKSFK